MKNKTDDVIPVNCKFVRLDLTSNPYLKLYLNKESTHCHNREKASNLVKNIVFNKNVKNDIFNKDLIEDSQIKLTAAEKFSAGMISEDQLEQFLHNERITRIQNKINNRKNSIQTPTNFNKDLIKFPSIKNKDFKSKINKLKLADKFQFSLQLSLENSESTVIDSVSKKDLDYILNKFKELNIQTEIEMRDTKTSFKSSSNKRSRPKICNILTNKNSFLKSTKNIDEVRRRKGNTRLRDFSNYQIRSNSRMKTKQVSCKSPNSRLSYAPSNDQFGMMRDSPKYEKVRSFFLKIKMKKLSNLKNIECQKIIKQAQELFHEKRSNENDKSILINLESDLRKISGLREDILREQENLKGIKMANQTLIQNKEERVNEFKRHNSYLDIITGYDGDFSTKIKIWKKNFDKLKSYSDQRVDWKAHRPFRLQKCERVEGDI